MRERENERKLLQLYGNVDGVLSNLVNKSSESSVRASVRLVKSYLQLIQTQLDGPIQKILSVVVGHLETNVFSAHWNAP